ncbi:hypothetical protein Tco_1062748 [Tanacetum coccineum]
MLWEWRGIANMDFIKLGGSSRVLSDFAEKYGSKNRVLAGFGIGGKSGKEKEAEYAGLKEAEYVSLNKAKYAGLNQAKYDRLIPSEICIQAEYDIIKRNMSVCLQAKYDRLSSEIC